MSGSRSTDGDKLKILIVDDLAQNIASLRQLLARDDLEIVAALSGNEALGLMLDHDFALVLLDVQMTGMDGFEVAELMRRHQKTRALPIIFLTAINKEQRHIFSGYEAGAMDYLFKPIDPFIIRAKVGAFLELKRSQLARERLVAELNRANQRLQEISDLKSDFLSAASHELRTPLTVIREFCSLVHDGIAGPVNDEQQKCLSAALRNCNRLAALVNDLLDLDSIESGNSHLHRTRVDLGGLLQSCVDDFQGRCAEASQTLRLEIGPAAEAPDESDGRLTLPAVLAAPEMVTQVLVNLVGNAHKFAQIGGEITVRVAVRQQDIEVDVQDNGPGISAEDQARVFEKFAQLNRRDGPGARGTGLGLPISRKIVELHGGHLDLTSRPGEGCLFRFNLPRFSDDAHLRAFVADCTRNPTGLPVSWSLVLLRSDRPDGLAPEVMAETTQAMVRSCEDRTGLVTVAGEKLPAILLKANRAGALAFCDRIGLVLAEKFPAAGIAQHALLDVSSGSVERYLADPESIPFSPLTSNPNGPRKGVLHV